MSHRPALLCAFRHPLILASIALLVINDHMLKYALPSPLTGKLSDFAGLFFFPFLLGALLQLLPFRRGLASRQALLAGMALSAAAFGAIKTLPAANQAALTMLHALLGLPVQIVLDPSDLLALSVLLPGWMLWQQIESHPLPPTRSRLVYLALAAGVLASLASTPCMRPSGVARLAGEGQLLYAGLLQWGAKWGEPLGAIMVSQDGGKTWTGVLERHGDALTPMQDAGPLVKNPFEQPVVYPKTACSPTDAKICYRLDGSTSQVLESRDGGATWQVAWQIPPGRISYIQRSASATTCSKEPDLQAFDLTFITNQDGTSTLFVSMGNEGLLKHIPGGDWQRVPFDAAWTSYAPVPTPFQATNILDAADKTMLEGWLAACAGLLAWLGLCLWLWLRSGVARPRIMLPLWLMLAASLVMPVPVVTLSPDAFRVIYYLASMPFFIFIFMLGLWYAGMSSDQPRVAGLAWTLFGFGLGIFLLPRLCFLLWALGILVTYETARLLAIVIGLALLLGSIFWLRGQMQHLQQEATP